MAVAKNQIQEVLNVILKHVKSIDVLTELRTTEAYTHNKSFAATIDRLIENFLKNKEPTKTQ